MPISYIQAFPLTPLGGAFVLPVGLCIFLGAVLPRLRLPLIGVGFALGLALIYALAHRLSAGMPPVHRFAVSSLYLAIFVEVLAFAVLMPRLRPRGERAAALASLMIVGGHFLIMTPAFGPLILALGVVGLANAWWGWSSPARPLAQVWATDGLLKAAFAITMIATALS